MIKHTLRRLAVALAATVVAAVSACSEVTPPVSDAEQFQLPAPGTYVALDREGNVLATGALTHTAAFERASWVYARILWAERARVTGERTRLAGHISTYSGPDPECSANTGDSQDELDEYAACVNRLFADKTCEVLVPEHFRESGDLHAHCGEAPA